jgi:hypothetical protein
MANLRTNADILDYALDNADEPTDSSSDFYTKAKVHYNRVHREICNGGASLNPELDETWYWMRKASPGVITLQPMLILTANVTFNSSAVTLSANLTPSIKDWFFSVPGDNGDVYRVAAHTSGTTGVTLDSVYTGTTGVAVEVHAVQLIYDLATDCKEVIGAMRGPREEDKIEGMDLESLMDEFPLTRITTGVPKAYAIVQSKKVRFSGYPGDLASDLIRIEYEYMIEPTDLDDDSGEPLVPLEHRQVLADYLTYYIMKDKNDNRMEGQGSLAQAGLIAMAEENRRRLARQGSGKFGQISPRWPKGARRGLLRTTSGHIITG